MLQISKLCFFLLLSALSFMAAAQPRPMIEGAHYATINPPLATRAKADIIEVLDVFWYGCPLCREFEPMMTYYGSEIRGDLIMRRMPAIWNKVMFTHAQVYFTAVELGIAEQAHPAAFRYVQEARMPLNNAAQAEQFFSTLGINPADFNTVWRSDKVAAEISQAQLDTATGGIERVPALVVNGRYQVFRNENVKELTEVVITANQLIRKLRNERRPDLSN